MTFNQETIARMRNPERALPPAPHYPYWRYFCPVCQEWWEGELFHEHFVVPCPDCQEVENQSKRRQGC